MSEVRIAAEPRTEFGKGAARRVRRANKVPAVLYGHGTPPVHVSLPSHDLLIALKNGGANTLLRLEGLAAGEQLCLPKSVVRDPIKGSFEHVDLIIVRQGEKVTVEIRLNVVGDITSDGMLDVSQNTLSVEAEATHIPSEFEISVEGFQVGDAIHARDIKLPANVTLAGDPDAVIVHVVAKQTAAQFEAETAAPEGSAPSPVVEPAAAVDE
ncbi:50S ribosomal protein L25/general stress protein Ctc [Acidothermaceae bacterium B102]|nr:50S ribosomal protein L25/general stress protein Ctc [Acidothermaceae bacterium B102]